MAFRHSLYDLAVLFVIFLLLVLVPFDRKPTCSFSSLLRSIDLVLEKGGIVTEQTLGSYSIDIMDLF